MQTSVALPVILSDRIIKPIEDKHFLVNLPTDYFHILNCIVHFNRTDDTDMKKCPTEEDVNGTYSLCRRLTANQYPAIIKNAYFKPSYKNPYFFINGNYVSAEDTPESILNPCEPISGNTMEIRCGDTKFYTPDMVYVDYLRMPKKIELTWDEVQSVEDTTPLCEFPDPVAYEIINIFCKLIFENAGDERLQTHYAINQTIGEVPKTDSSKK